jgi:hypothetical protein
MPTWLTWAVAKNSLVGDKHMLIGACSNSIQSISLSNKILFIFSDLDFYNQENTRYDGAARNKQ